MKNVFKFIIFYAVRKNMFIKRKINVNIIDDIH